MRLVHRKVADDETYITLVCLSLSSAVESLMCSRQPCIFKCTEECHCRKEAWSLFWPLFNCDRVTYIYNTSCIVYHTIICYVCHICYILVPISATWVLVWVSVQCSYKEARNRWDWLLLIQGCPIRSSMFEKLEMLMACVWTTYAAPHYSQRSHLP